MEKSFKRDQLLKLLNAITDSKNTTQVSLPPMVPALCKEEEILIDAKLLKGIPQDGVRCNCLCILGYKKLENLKTCKNREENPIYLEVCEECSK